MAPGRKRKAPVDPDVRDIVLLLSSDEEDDSPKRGAKARPGSRKPPLPKAKKARRREADKDEERRGGLVLSQPTSDDGGQSGKGGKAGKQSLLTFATARPAAGGAQGPTLHLPPREPTALGLAGAGAQEGVLWAHKHEPLEAADLAVHKRKVDEVRAWLAGRRDPLGALSHGSNLLFVSGPAGCGKTATLRVLARELGFALTEWTAPPPTLWDEHLYQAGSGRGYVSKLDAFEAFVARSKLTPLHLEPTPGGPVSASQRSSQELHHSQELVVMGPRPPATPLVLVEDLPHAAGPEQRGRLAAALARLAASARGPVVVAATTAQGASEGSRGGRDAGRGSADGLHRDLLSAMEEGGATHIRFNPFTVLNLAKAVERIALAEGLASVTKESARVLSEQAGGSLHNALETLQLAVCDAPRRPASQPQKGRRRPKRKAAGGEPEDAASGTAVPGLLRALGRDAALGAFHALGKLLHNKRLGAGGAPQAAVGEDGGDGGEGAEGPSPASASPSGLLAKAAAAAQLEQPLHLASRLQRPPPKSGVEGVLGRLEMEAGQLLGLLHENGASHVGPGALGQWADALGYLGDADVLHAGRFRGDLGALEEDSPTTSFFAEAAAAAVGARGYCFSVVDMAPSSFQPLRGPLGNAVDHARRHNREQLRTPAWAAGAQGLGGAMGSSRAFAVELLPWLRGLAAAGAAPARAALPRAWQRLWGGQVFTDTLAPEPGPAEAPQSSGVQPLPPEADELPEDDAVESVSDTE